MSRVLKVFPKPNLSNDWKCPFCDTNKEAPIVLVPILDTGEGNNMEAKQVHFDCVMATASVLLGEVLHTNEKLIDIKEVI